VDYTESGCGWSCGAETRAWEGRWANSPGMVNRTEPNLFHTNFQAIVITQFHPHARFEQDFHSNSIRRRYFCHCIVFALGPLNSLLTSCLKLGPYLLKLVFNMIALASSLQSIYFIHHTSYIAVGYWQQHRKLTGLTCCGPWDRWWIDWVRNEMWSRQWKFSEAVYAYIGSKDL